MLNEAGLRRAVDAADVTAPVRWDDVTTSTNDVAWAMAADGTPAWTVVAAGHQTQGRGRLDRRWEDRPGQALLCSVVLRPDIDPERLGLIPLAAGVAMAAAASELAAVRVRCKWPNDLTVDGRKVGGILARAEVRDVRVRHVVVGVGVNLAEPARVADAAGLGEVDSGALLTGFLRRLRPLIERDRDSIVGEWVRVSDTVGRRVVATTVGGDGVRGVAADVDDDGALLVDTDAGRVRVASGDVQHLRDAP
jgi:BirA family biotin operon repressor/biotin-[acetyl-CoA-carboxylase] ligase